MTHTPKDLVREFVEAVNTDPERAAALVGPGFVRHSAAAGEPGVRSREDLVRFLRSERETFPDAHETIEDVVAEGDRVAVRHRFTGTQLGPLAGWPPTGHRMTADYLAIYRIADGLIAEAWAEWDNMAGLRQLGHLPEGHPR
ncbi:ester cyclase [Demequina sp. SO4-13]|uniref:ester cyclase n=1 Tax=Demequina sp. SO4-13 TaxID=3401027 RepID=UPI003AF4665A